MVANQNIIQSNVADFNFALTTCSLIFTFDEHRIDDLSEPNRENLTKVAVVIEYVGNRQKNATLCNWKYSPYTPGVESASIARIKRIMTVPKVCFL